MELNEGLTEFRRRYAWVKPLDEDRRRQARTAMVPFAAGAVLVLVIAGANVSGLLASRAAARRREFAVRRALGGDTAQLLRAAFAESTFLCRCGGSQNKPYCDGTHKRNGFIG
jgi:CDGSH-type Zn-finger protein